MHFRYDKKAEDRDQGRAEQIRQEFDCSGYTVAHLRNALRFAKGCAGLEAVERKSKLQAELSRRGINQ